MKPPFRTLTCVLAVSALLGIATAPSFADEGVQAGDEVIAAIESVVPEVVDRAVVPDVQPSGDIDISSNFVEVAVDPVTAEVAAESDTATLTVELPKSDVATLVGSEDDVPVFDNGDGSSTAVFGNYDGTLTIVNVTNSADGPTRFDYTYGGVDELRQAPDGGVTAWAGDVMVAYFLTPWAFDAQGTSVPTWFEVDGNVLTQVVDHTSETFVYPIVSDPTQNLGGNSFYSNITLDINPTAGTTIVRVTPAPNINWSRLPRSTGLPPYYALVPSTYEGQKYQDQLVCHWVNAGYAKVPWNLDSWRPNVGYAATVAAGCNP